MLLRPLEARLRGVGRLLVVPDGPLASLPLGALCPRLEPSAERLVERLEIDYVPSASVLVFLRGPGRSRPGNQLLALGDPAYVAESDRPPPVALPHSRAEVDAVAARFPADRRRLLFGQEATSAGLRAALDATREPLAALHLACHALVDPSQPRSASLLLGAASALDLDDVYALSVPADVVVLSACDTALGRTVRGEGVVGLVRGFMFAGARQVLASAWKVHDASAGDLMARFYAGWREEGRTPSAALRQAQLERLRAGGPRAHPRFWAGFLLWGGGG